MCTIICKRYIQAFVDNAENPPEVWAHKKLPLLMERTFMVGQVRFRRAARQFGMRIPSRENAGIGGHVSYGEGQDAGILHPDHLLENDEDVTIAGNSSVQELL